MCFTAGWARRCGWFRRPTERGCLSGWAKAHECPQQPRQPVGGSRTDRRDRSLTRLVTDMLTFLMHLLEGAAVALVVGFIVTFVDAAEQRQMKRMKIARSARPSMAGSAVKKD